MKTEFHSLAQGTLLPYETPESLKIVFKTRVSLCQGSPMDEYTGRGLDDDFASDVNGIGGDPNNGGSL